jgi:hypothetical protein
MIKHKTPAPAAPDRPGRLNKGEWDEEHVVDGGDDGDVLTRDTGAQAGWEWRPNIGAQGATGAQGAQGPGIGVQGAQGGAGAQGSVGAQGLTGAQGDAGAQGATVDGVPSAAGVQADWVLKADGNGGYGWAAP